MALAREIGSAVTLETVPGEANGFYEIPTRRIAIEQNLEVNQQVATLCHELAHALL